MTSTAGTPSTEESKTSTPSGASSESKTQPIANLTEAISGRAREDKRVKAGRLLLSGRLRVLMVNGSLISAECRGDSGEVYKLDYGMSREGLWTCSCPARTDCSHLAALWAVVAVER